MDDTPKPVVEHLDELRRRLFWVIGTWLLLSGIAAFAVRDVFEILMGPAVDAVRSRGRTLIAIAPSELFMTYVKTAVLAGFLGSMPMILYQAWAFVAPGLYPRERRFALPFVLIATGLFAAGCAFGYFTAFPQVFKWLLALEADYVETAWTTQTVFGFMARLYVGFGVAFELPVVLVLLALAGVVTPAQLAHWRRYAILALFTAAAILTPSPDAISQMLLAVPLCLLYESSIWISYLILGRRQRGVRLPEPHRT
jgi:sec-independent protein translocase protein TatC